MAYNMRTMARKRDGCPACGEHHPENTLVCPITGVSLRFSDPSRAVGEVIGGKYRIDKLLGKGGMGAVYEARHIELEKRVAIKILLPESSVKPQQVERFKREARSAASLGHANIVEIFDLDRSEDGSVFIVMEYLNGMDLGDTILEAKGPLPVHRAAGVACQAARGLGKAHEHGIVHRDLKPENIFLARTDDGDVVKIVDFGIAMMRQQGEAARLTAEGVLIGTPFYMSPEQARGERDLDARTDIYALGTVLFEMLTGRVPFDGDTYLEILAKHQMDPPPSLHETSPDLRCPADIEALLRRMLEKNRDQRPSSMTEVERTLARFAMDPSGETMPAGDVNTTGKDGFAETLIAFQSDQRELEALSTPPGQDSPTNGLGWTEETGPPITSEMERSRKRRGWGIALGALGVLAVVAAVAAVLVVLDQKGRGEQDTERPAEQFVIDPAVQPPGESGSSPTAEPVQVQIELQASPETAVITIDGNEQTSNPALASVPREQSVTLRAEAPGYVPMEKEIIADRDRSFSWVLEPILQEKTVVKKSARPHAAPVKDEVEPQEKKPKTTGKKKVKLDKENPYLKGN